MMPTESSTTPASPKNLFDPIQYVPGVGPSRAELLRKMGIGRALDLLFFFPRHLRRHRSHQPGQWSSRECAHQRCWSRGRLG